MDDEMVAQTIAALTSSLKTIEVLNLRGVKWQTDEALTQLLQFIARAPKLQKCDIGD